MTAPTVLQIGQARREEMANLFQRFGTLTADQVLDYARDPATALHTAFTWDDSEAADRYRKIEASRLIRRTFIVMEVPGSNEERRVHMAVSLPADRGVRGYRLMTDVLSDPERRDQLVRSALRDLAAFRNKYGALSELAEVFAAADQITHAA